MDGDIRPSCDDFEFYEGVVVSDCDEFLVADPENFQYLHSALQHHHHKVTGFAGLNVFQGGNSHTYPIDWAEPILNQCHWLAAASDQTKPCFFRVPRRISGGGHGVFNKRFEPSNSIYNIHLKYCDPLMFAKQSTQIKTEMTTLSDDEKKRIGSHWQNLETQKEFQLECYALKVSKAEHPLRQLRKILLLNGPKRKNGVWKYPLPSNLKRRFLIPERFKHVI